MKWTGNVCSDMDGVHFANYNKYKTNRFSKHSLCL